MNKKIIIGALLASLGGQLMFPFQVFKYAGFVIAFIGMLLLVDGFASKP